MHLALYLPLSLHTNKDLLLFDIKEQSQRLVTFETFDQSDEETRPDQKKAMTKRNTKTKTMTKTNTFKEPLQRAIPETHDLETFNQSDEET